MSKFILIAVEVLNGINYVDTIFEGLGASKSDLARESRDWNWFQIFNVDNKNVVSMDDINEPNLENYEVDLNLSIELNFRVLDILFTFPFKNYITEGKRMEMIKNLKNKFDCKKMRFLEIPRSEDDWYSCNEISSDDIVEYESEYLVIRELFTEKIYGAVEDKNYYPNIVALSYEELSIYHRLYRLDIPKFKMEEYENLFKNNHNFAIFVFIE